MIKVKIGYLNQHAGTVTVTDEEGRTHTGRWNNNEEVYNIVGGSTILKAAMHAWGSFSGKDGGPPLDEFELTQDELEKHSGGWWTYPRN